MPRGRCFGVSRNSPPMLMSRTGERSSWPWQCQYAHTHPVADSRVLNLLDGAVAGRKAGTPIVLDT